MARHHFATLLGGSHIDALGRQASLASCSIGSSFHILGEDDEKLVLRSFVIITAIVRVIKLQVTVIPRISSSRPDSRFSRLPTIPRALMHASHQVRCFRTACPAPVAISASPGEPAFLNCFFSAVSWSLDSKHVVVLATYSSFAHVTELSPFRLVLVSSSSSKSLFSVRMVA